MRTSPALHRALLCALLGLAAPAAADERITGFTTHGSGELSGTVTARDGKPLAGVTVNIAPSSGARQQVVTDVHGRYRAEVKDGGAYTLVFIKASDAVRLSGQISVPTHVDEYEAIEIHETVAPAVMPRPLSSTSSIPEYSDAAKQRGPWTRAHLLLDVDDRGLVARLKLLGKPGYDLDRIATRDAFKLRFEPARDRVGRPISAMVLWSYEWPSFWWITEQKLPVDRLPSEALKIPCKGAGGTLRYYRDCSTADLTRDAVEPWIERPRK